MTHTGKEAGSRVRPGRRRDDCNSAWLEAALGSAEVYEELESAVVRWGMAGRISLANKCVVRILS